jgi:hypothetical protein
MNGNVVQGLMWKVGGIDFSPTGEGERCGKQEAGSRILFARGFGEKA